MVKILNNVAKVNLLTLKYVDCFLKPTENQLDIKRTDKICLPIRFNYTYNRNKNTRVAPKIHFSKPTLGPDLVNLSPVAELLTVD